MSAWYNDRDGGSNGGHVPSDYLSGTQIQAPLPCTPLVVPSFGFDWAVTTCRFRDKVARKALSATAWIFAIAAISLGASHAMIAISFTSVPAVACLAIAMLGFVIGATSNKAPVPVAFVSILSASSLIAARIIEDNADTPHSLAPESLFLASQVLAVLGLVFIIRRRLVGQAGNVLADGLIVGIGAWLVVWVYLVQPSLGATGNSATFTTIRSITLGVAMIVLFLLATLLSPKQCHPPQTLLLASPSHSRWLVSFCGLSCLAETFHSLQPPSMLRC